MRKKIVLGFLTALCMAVLVGCGDTSSKDDTSKNDTGHSEMNEELPDMEKTFLAEKTPWKDSKNLYEISLEDFNGVTQSEVYRVGNDLLLVYAQYDKEEQKAYYHVKLIELESGEVLHELRLDALVYGKVQILENGIAIHDLGDGKSYLLDESLQIAEKYELPEGMFCMNPSGDAIYRFTYDEGIKKMDPESGKEVVLHKNMREIFLCETTSEKAIFTYVDVNTLFRHTGIMDLSTGKVQNLDSAYPYGSIEYADDVWVGKVDTEEIIYVIGTSGKQEQFFANMEAWVNLNQGSGQILVADTTEDEIPFISVYDASGKCLSYCETKDLVNAVYYDPVWFEEYNGYLFTLMDSAGEEHLLFWDVSGDSEGEPLVMEQVEEPGVFPEGNAVSKELYDRAKQLSDTYGVQILIADQCDTEFVDHTAELLTSESDIEQALDTIEYVLNRYPEGFFEQLKHNAYQEIEIQVLGMLAKASSTEEATYISGGFVNSSYPGKLLMALDARATVGEDVNNILEKTMYHEFSHIIDQRMEYQAKYEKDAYYSNKGWLELNPDGFEYNDSYYGTLDAKYADFFVDAYACSYATEDRARVMEYAMAKDVNTFAGKAGLIRKLEYYCKGIRDTFDTEGWPKETPWEETLHAVQ